MNKERQGKNMPDKNPEDKRKWEREHHAQRNAQRRKRHFESHEPGSTIELVSISENKTGSGWKTFMTFVVGIGIVMLTGLAGGQWH